MKCSQTKRVKANFKINLHIFIHVNHSQGLEEAVADNSTWAQSIIATSYMACNVYLVDNMVYSYIQQQLQDMAYNDMCSSI